MPIQAGQRSMAPPALDVFPCSRFILFTFSRLRVVAHVRIHLTKTSSAAPPGASVAKRNDFHEKEERERKTARRRLQRLVRASHWRGTACRTSAITAAIKDR